MSNISVVSQYNKNSLNLVRYGYDKKYVMRNQFFVDLHKNSSEDDLHHLYDRGRFEYLDGTTLVTPLPKAVYLSKDMLSEYDEFLVMKKTNGFLLNVTINLNENELYFSTTGNIIAHKDRHLLNDNDNQFLQFGVEMFNSYIDKNHFIDLFVNSNLQTALNTIGDHNNIYTLSFECVHPDDMHIVEETLGLYLLSANTEANLKYRLMGFELDYLHESLKSFAEEVGCFKNELFSADFDELSELLGEPNSSEGYIVYVINDESAVEYIQKFKTDYYSAKKFLMRSKIEKIEEMIVSDQKLRDSYLNENMVRTIYSKLSKDDFKDKFTLFSAIDKIPLDCNL